VYIIPDSNTDLKLRNDRLLCFDQLRPTWKDFLLCLLLLATATGVGFVFTRFGFSESNLITVFILGVLITSVVTVSPVFSAVSSLASVLLFNYFFTEPKFSLHTYGTEYVVTFGIMLISSLITGTLANRLKENASRSALEAFRSKVLFDTNQLLQKAGSSEAVISITANQLTTLLDRDVIVRPMGADKTLEQGTLFHSAHSDGSFRFQEPTEAEAAEWVFRHQQIAGAHSSQFSSAQALYCPICINSYCYGVFGIHLESKPLEAFEYSVVLSILGECALALESLRNAQEKEQAAVIAHNEQLRSNLLRSISHDIRTPLTSISGNASNLLSHYQYLDENARKQMFSDIYDDSQWLIHLVENLLSISRFENGQMQMHQSLDVVNDVIQEALRHIDRSSERHTLTVRCCDDLLLAKMDTGLIAQVVINLVNNAVKHTQDGSEICVSTEEADGLVLVTVSDNGPGIPEEQKPHIFELFYTGRSTISDGRRGMGLGLALCSSIVEAHGGTISLTDNQPSGCRFTFTLPAEKVTLYE
jgi:two-component system sensor histidine kinase KdpD